MGTHFFSCKQAKQIDLVGYLDYLGFAPQKIRNHDYWYLSPLRKEKTPSFKVNRQLNAWYDHGTGQGGNLIDFGLLYHQCRIPELLSILPASFSFHEGNSPPKEPCKISELDPSIRVVAVKPLAHPALCRYLVDRRIPFRIGRQYTQEVNYTLNGRTYFAIGFKNDAGGYELRNRHFKGSSSPKSITLIKAKSSQAEELSVFEGFFSFLSYQTIVKDQTQPLTDFLVLNSLSFFKRELELMSSYRQTNLFLDNDPVGDKATEKALLIGRSFIDRRGLFKGYKDLNQWITEPGHTRKDSNRPNSG